MTSKSQEKRLALQGAPVKRDRVWTLYKAPDLQALAIGLETCELGNWTVFQILPVTGTYVIVASKVLA